MGLSAFNRARALANEKAKAENESVKVEGVTVETPKVEVPTPIETPIVTSNIKQLADYNEMVIDYKSLIKFGWINIFNFILV